MNFSSFLIIKKVTPLKKGKKATKEKVFKIYVGF